MEHAELSIQVGSSRFRVPVILGGFCLRLRGRGGVRRGGWERTKEFGMEDWQIAWNGEMAFLLRGAFDNQSIAGFGQLIDTIK